MGSEMCIRDRSRTDVALQVATWQQRVSTSDGVVCWQIRLLPPGTLLPSRALCAFQSDHGVFVPSASHLASVLAGYIARRHQLSAMHCLRQRLQRQQQREVARSRFHRLTHRDNILEAHSEAEAAQQTLLCARTTLRRFFQQQWSLEVTRCFAFWNQLTERYILAQYRLCSFATRLHRPLNLIVQQCHLSQHRRCLHRRLRDTAHALLRLVAWRPFADSSAGIDARDVLRRLASQATARRFQLQSRLAYTTSLPGVDARDALKRLALRFGFRRSLQLLRLRFASIPPTFSPTRDLHDQAQMDLADTTVPHSPLPPIPPSPPCHVSLQLRVGSGGLVTAGTHLVGNRVVHIVRQFGVLDESVTTTLSSDGIICVATDCTSKALSGAALKVSKALPFSRRSFAGKPFSRYSFQRHWRPLGSAWLSERPDGNDSAPRVCHLYSAWSHNSPQGARVLPQGDTSTSHPTHWAPTPRRDTAATRHIAFSDSLDHLSACLGSDHAGTIAFTWADCVSYQAQSLLDSFASRHPRARVLCVQRSDETIAHHVSRQRAAVKVAAADARAFLKDSDCGSVTRRTAMALCNTLECNLLDTISAKRTDYVELPSFVESLAARLKDPLKGLTAVEARASQRQASNAARTVRMSNEMIDEAYRTQVRDALHDGSITREQLLELHDQHLAVKRCGARLAPGTSPDAACSAPPPPTQVSAVHPSPPFTHSCHVRSVHPCLLYTSDAADE